MRLDCALSSGTGVQSPKHCFKKRTNNTVQKGLINENAVRKGLINVRNPSSHLGRLGFISAPRVAFLPDNIRAPSQSLQSVSPDCSVCIVTRLRDSLSRDDGSIAGSYNQFSSSPQCLTGSLTHSGENRDFFHHWQSGRDVKQATHLHIIPRLSVCWALSPLSELLDLWILSIVRNSKHVDRMDSPWVL
jgi:hypothetical protein